MIVLSDLNDDVLLELAGHVENIPPAEFEGGFIDNEPLHQNLKNLSLANRRMHTLLCPVILRSIVLGHQRGGKGRPWDRAHEVMKKLSDDERLVKNVRKMKVDMDHSWSIDDINTLGPTKLSIMVGFMRTLTNLRSLNMSLLDDDIPYFEKVLADAPAASSLRFDVMRRLKIPFRMAYLLKYCSKTASVTFYDPDAWLLHEGPRFLSYNLDLRQLAIYAPNITRFEANAVWDEPSVTRLSSTYPHLRHLSMYGEFAFRLVSNEPKVKIVKSICAAFKSVRVLAMENLLGFQEVSIRRRNRIYEIDNGETLGLYALKAVRKRNCIAEVAFANSLSLQEFWLDKHDVVYRAVEPLRDAVHGQLDQAAPA